MSGVERQTLRGIAESLSRRNRLVFLLRYADRLSVEEIGVVLDLPPEQVAVALAEVRFRFREALRPPGAR